MTPLIFNLGPTELLIILAIVLLLFGGARLAGLGKSSGRAIREFKEETDLMRSKDNKSVAADKDAVGSSTNSTATGTHEASTEKPVEAEIVDDGDQRRV